MDEKQANAMVNLLASIEKKMSAIVKALENKESKKSK